MKQSQFGQLQQQTVIPLPMRTRAILEKKLANKSALMALAKAEEQSINDMIEAAREMLGVPDSWTIKSTEAGFVAPAGAVAPTVEVPPADDFDANPEPQAETI